MGSRQEREICAVFWWLCLFVEAAPGRNRGIPGAGKSRTTLPPLLHLSRGGGGEEVSCDKNSQILRKIYGFYNFSLFWLWPNKIKYIVSMVVQSGWVRGKTFSVIKTKQKQENDCKEDGQQRPQSVQHSQLWMEVPKRPSLGKKDSKVCNFWEAEEDCKRIAETSLSCSVCPWQVLHLSPLPSRPQIFLTLFFVGINFAEPKLRNCRLAFF